MWHDSICNTVQEPTLTSTIVAKKTTTWGESGFPSEFLGGELDHFLVAGGVGLAALGVGPLEERSLLAAVTAGAVQGLEESG